MGSLVHLATNKKLMITHYLHCCVHIMLAIADLCDIISNELCTVDDGGGRNGLSSGTMSGIVVGGIVIIIIGGGMSMLVIFLFKKKRRTKSVGMLLEIKT